jgi:hypothetical protein
MIAEARRNIYESDVLFGRKREPLFSITGHHYYDVVVKPLREAPRFGATWSEAERDGQHDWRWLDGKEGTIDLPALSGPAKLRISFSCPRAVSLELLLNGETLASLRDCSGEVVKEFDVSGRNVNVLTLRAPRDVSGSRLIRLQSLTWGRRRT